MKILRNTATALLVSTRVIALISALPLSALAAQGDSHDNHAAHQHGLAQLLIMKDAAALQLELHSPAANMLGFEHIARTPEQQAAVVALRNRLMAAQSLFVFTGNTCVLQEVNVDTAVLQQDVAAAQHEHEADHQHDDSNEKSDHGDITAIYRYQCATVDKLESVDVQLLTYFSGIVELQAQSLVDGQQQANTLTQNVRVISY